MNTPISAALNERVRVAGGRLYEVGGAVRDTLLGLTPKDFDYVVTGIVATRLPEVFHGWQVDLVGASFGVFKVRVGDQDHAVTVDVALPRTERSTGPGHTDFEVTASHDLPVEDDLLRRDFTVNAIAQDVESGEFIDPSGGRADLKARQLRFVGHAGTALRRTRCGCCGCSGWR